MRRRLAALLLALVALLGVGVVSSPQPARADGIIGNGAQGVCQFTAAPVLGAVMYFKGSRDPRKVAGVDLCDKIGDAVEKKIKDEWKEIWESLLGDIIKSAADVARWLVRTVLTVAVVGPSIDLSATGLWGKDATLSGMLVWLGLVIAAAGFMWQLGKMAVTGQIKHAGRAMVGWVENMVLSAIGVSLFALALVAADALSAGLVNATFANDGAAYERILLLMIPTPVSNPIMMLGLAVIMVIVGFAQLITVFLRQSAIPIICLLLPVAGAGRVGGDATRQWAPKLITAGLVVVTYKPILALIICIGFAEFGHAQTFAEWLRGCATLILGVLAPAPLTRIFAPFGEAVGGGMASGGASGALGAAAGYFAGKSSKGEGGKGEGGDAAPSAAPGANPGGNADGPAAGGAAGAADPIERARQVEQSMGQQAGGQGGDAQAQAARDGAGASVPGQSTGPDGAPGAAGQAGMAPGAAPGAAAATGGASAAGRVALGIQVLDGVNDAIQRSSGQIGGGDRQ
ncbi:hypothetical protein GCM10010363_60450 [Streptomyces omiyaensis]|uniref:hypothetical protein n=1 Tax=Streptomyces omiyaensis TaxID=68247 RepID=UPI001671AC87|nr:hypothetical protein [Streptomyces omiyaensis]GGY71185.1 hypothetical protein GCM10010363_60450 [Streptomyces omiyaensis]